MVMDGVRQHLDLNPSRIRQWADRKTGIGFDQCLVILPTTSLDADFDYRIFNPDGSEAGQCGNGARCVALWIQREGLSQASTLRLKTRDRVLTCIVQDDRNVTVDMGVPEWLPEEPCTTTYHAVSMGNPHAVIRVESLEDFPLEQVATQIRQQKNFPDGVNVGAMQILSPTEIRLRVNERGAGETAACGSGACAAMVVGRQFFQLSSKVTVHLTGGPLSIEWSGKPNAGVWMTGPGETVYQGQLTP